MQNFESSPPKARPRESSFENTLDERKNALENLVQRFPKLRSLVTAFVLTTAALSAPELLRATDSPQEPDPEQHDTVDEEATHEELKSAFSKLWQRVEGVGTDIPKNSTYHDTLEHLSANGTHTFSDTDSGVLPESANDIIIGHEVATVTADYTEAVGERDSADLKQAMKSVFYVAPVESATVVEGGTSQIVGFGSTRAEALQSALESAANFIGVDITSGSRLENSSLTGDDTSSAESALTSHASTKSRHVLKEYKIIADEQPSGGAYPDGQKSIWSDNFSQPEHRVTIEITGGTLVPAP